MLEKPRHIEIVDGILMFLGDIKLGFKVYIIPGKSIMFFHKCAFANAGDSIDCGVFDNLDISFAVAVPEYLADQRLVFCDGGCILRWGIFTKWIVNVFEAAIDVVPN